MLSNPIGSNGGSPGGSLVVSEAHHQEDSPEESAFYRTFRLLAYFWLSVNWKSFGTQSLSQTACELQNFRLKRVCPKLLNDFLESLNLKAVTGSQKNMDEESSLKMLFSFFWFSFPFL